MSTNSKPRKLFIFSRKGITLSELIIAIGLGSVISLAIYAVIVTSQQKSNSAILSATLFEKSQQIKSLLANQQTLKNTIASAQNPNMACLRNSDRRIPCNATFVASAFSMNLDRIVLFDNATSPIGGNVFYNSQVGSTSGFTEQGAKCTGFSADGNGNDLCPIGYIINWRLSSPGTFSGVTLTFTAKLIYNPLDSNPNKKKINATLKTPLGKYDVIVNHTLESLLDVSQLTCNQDGVTIPNKSSQLFYKNSVVPFGSTCESEIRSCYDMNGTLVLGGSAPYATCRQSCKGAWSACSAPCGGGTQYFTIYVPSNQWGVPCSYTDGQTQTCGTGACTGAPVDCVGDWGTCSNGFQTYTISVVNSAGGAACPFETNSTRGCGTSCVGSWGSCYNGTQTYNVTTAASGGGLPCPFVNGVTQSCGVSCVGGWSACVNHVQNYAISIPAAGGGVNCANLQGATRSCVSCTWAVNEGASHQNYVLQLLKNIIFKEAEACLPACSGTLGCDASLCCALDNHPCTTGGTTTTCSQYSTCNDNCTGPARTLTCSCF